MLLETFMAALFNSDTLMTNLFFGVDADLIVVDYGRGD
jgi:hypothetical protein